MTPPSDAARDHGSDGHTQADGHGVQQRQHGFRQSDGGDCTLLKVENNDVYLKLIGACNGCPSSTITLRMGIETVLKEVFPQMNELIQVEHSF